jgi:ketosteroid isomerase-like protein
MSSSNVELVSKTFDAFSAGGFEAMLPFFPDDVVWYPAPGWIEDTVHHGHDGVRDMAAVWTDNFDDLTLTPCEMRDLGDRVLVLAESSARIRGTATPIRQPYAMIYSDFRDQKIGEVRFYFTWQTALDDCGLTE